MNFIEGLNRVVVVHPTAPNVQLPALLEYKSGSSTDITFDLFPDPLPKWLSESRLDCLQVILPEVAILTDLLKIGGSRGSKVMTISYRADMMIVGKQEPLDQILLTELTLRIGGGSAWLGISGFKGYSGFSLNDPTQLTYEPVTDMIWEVREGLTISYGCDLAVGRSFIPVNSVTFSESSHLTIHVTSPKSLDELFSDLRKVISFMEFLTNEPIQITGVSGKRSVDDEHLFFNAPWKQSPLKYIGNIHHETFFRVFESNFAEHLQKWFDLYDKIPLALGIYSTCKHSSDLQVEFRYFGIVSALESLHRYLFEEDGVHGSDVPKESRRKTLESRLQELVKKNPGCLLALLPYDDCKRVAATRNYLAHQKQNLEERIFPSDQWFFWYRRLSTVFEFTILSILPFVDKRALVKIVNRRRKAIRSGSQGEWNFK